MTNNIDKAIEKLREIGEKKQAIETTTIEWKYEELERRKKENNAFNNLSIGPLSKESVQELIDRNREYVELAKNGSVFLGIDDFNGIVPMFARNIILIAAKTGTGKSTTSANVTLQAIRQGKKTLIISNEENPTDILNRVIFNMRGWHYSDHSKITAEQQAEMDKMYPLLNSMVTIVTDDHNGIGGTTTTLEGIEAILTTLRKQDLKYDVVMLDYIQNVVSSIKVPSLEQWKVIDRVAKLLDQFKNHYNSPIIVLSQLKEGDAPFKERIEKCKSFFNSTTCAIEVDADFEKRCTTWTIRKARFNGTNGKKIVTGYSKGKYVKYDVEFDLQVQSDRLKQEVREKQINNGVKLQDAMEKLNALEKV